MTNDVIPETWFLLKLGVVVALVVAICVWLSMAFQAILFQRYRLHKNEAARRKARLHEEELAAERYRTELLGAIKEEKPQQGE